MPKNERKTESIVRKHFEAFLDQIILEEQSSDNPKIKKLLSTASKSGLGGGYPEFIIQYRNNPDFIIVVECKADITKHESKNRDSYKDFSVDGVLLYSSYLAKEFDVLSIAISGESETNVNISHFLQVKGDKTAIQIFSNKLLSPENYFHGYIKSPEKFRQDYEKLLTFSKALNENLHSHKIVESDRGLLISCILIALENKAFSNSYKDYTDPKQLAEFLTTTVKNEFQNGNIGDAKLAVLVSRFEFIKTDTSLSKKENVLRDIISDINANIKDFIKTHEYFDVLGQLYIEFLRYANSDKGLGIVLTPPHITGFMAELAEVNKDSVVYDNCTGTGGFLVSAMNLMIKDAKGDQTKILSIKKDQLIGVEYQAHIFALACSNMFIHQDGKSNILNGSCFDEDVLKEVKAYKPTVGLLNPPYKADKKSDTDEYEFILNNLDCLVQGGKCVAIIPMQSALAQTGKVYEYKKKILEQHTLEAVFSMPDELFFNSKVGVVSCIMVFTAKRPHPENKRVYFGYYKDDGFVKRKHKGRVDLYQKFEKEIKEDWITSYINSEVRAGFSVTRSISAEDEWCAEAYMETNYREIGAGDFINSIHNFVGFQFSTGNIQEIKNAALTEADLQLFDRKWKYFKYEKLFDEISRGQRLTKTDRTSGDILYFSASEFNNGCTDKISNPLFVKQDAIIYTTFGDAYYVKGKFTASDEISIFQHAKLNIFSGIFVSTVISKNKYKYCFGRKAFKNKYTNDDIALPVNNDGEPDWQFMETYIKSLPYSSNL